jgi:3-hydroxybutyryl-CoA dehydrogenase
VTIEQGERPSESALIVVTPYGKDATTAAIEEGLDARRVVAVDCLFAFGTSGALRRRTLMTTPVTDSRFRDEARALFAHDGAAVTVIRDSSGFVAQRIIATIVNIGCDIAQQRIASPDDIDLAVTLGLGYPGGPLAMGDAIGAVKILEILRNMSAALGDPRYRPSPWLARRAQLRMSLTQADS